MPPFRSTFFFRYFLRARGYIYLQKTPVVLRVWVLPSRHSSGSPQLDLILDWPRIHTCTRVSRSYNYSSHGELPTRRWCHSKCVVRYSSRCVRYHVFCVRICQLDGVCRGALCTNQISEINRDWGMLDHLYFGEELEKLRLNFFKKRRDNAAVRPLASNQSGPRSVPGPGVTCGLNLWLVLVPVPGGFLRVLRFSSLHKNQHSKFQFDPEMRVTG